MKAAASLSYCIVSEHKFMFQFVYIGWHVYRMHQKVYTLCLLLLLQLMHQFFK